MKELKHLHKLIDELRAAEEYDLADKIEKRAQDLFLIKAKSIKKEQTKETNKD